jgi:hypothetical protein
MVYMASGFEIRSTEDNPEMRGIDNALMVGQGHTQIHRLILMFSIKLGSLGITLITSKVLDVRCRGAIEGNAADDALMVDQEHTRAMDNQGGLKVW